MSIATKRGDAGQTDLMYGRRVSKCDRRVAGYGVVDELNAAIGVARVHCAQMEIIKVIVEVQDDLIVLMGEMATDEADLDRYVADGFERIEEEIVERASAHVVRIEEAMNIRFKGWAVPGKEALPGAAFLDVARTVCRRAERVAAGLAEAGTLKNKAILSYLNRLSDLLWLLARWEAVSNQTGKS
jgi:cob(I)alamin adenosyltransferase